MGYPERSTEGRAGCEVYAEGIDQFDGTEALCEVLFGTPFCWRQVLIQGYHR